MPDWKDDYNAQILRARNAVMGGNGKTAEAYLMIYRAMAQALIDLESSFTTNDMIRKAVVRRNMQKMMEGFKAIFPRIIENYQDTAMRQIIEAHVAGIENAIRATGMQIPDSVIAGLFDDKLITNALEYYPIRQGFGTKYNFKTLINLRITEFQDQIDRLIASGIQRGISAKKLTQELAYAMSKNDPEFQKVLRSLGPKGGRLAKKLRLVDGDMLKKEIPRAKKLLHQAQRIAVSEINNAYNEADRLATMESPVVEYNKWQVSSRHHDLPSTPDACTFNYETDQFGFGSGVFPVQTTPPLLHPYCGCYTLKIMRSPDQWLEPKPEPPAPKIHNERGYRRFFKGKTTAHRNRNIDLVNKLNRMAYDFYQ